MGLEQIRQKIDIVDGKLKQLFLERMSYVKEVLAIKKKEGLPVRHIQREQEILEKKLADITEFQEETRAFLKSLIQISCHYQEKGLAVLPPQRFFSHLNRETFIQGIQTYCYQGIPGSYSWEAGGELFPRAEGKGMKTFYDVCQSVIEGTCQVGVLPLENLAAGSVSQVYDLIEEFKLHIVDELSLPIRHCLLGTGRLEDITQVKSHPQALAQCSRYLQQQGWEEESFLNTATAAKWVAQEKNPAIGAICNKKNASLYGLQVLAENIADLEENQTRFVVVSKEKIIVGNPKKTSFVFTLPHHPGSLSDALMDFSAHQLNLTKIESRPLKSNEWEYLFFAEVDGSLLTDSVYTYFSQAGHLFHYFRWIGCY